MNQQQFKVGQRVRFNVGRGRFQGTVKEVDADKRRLVVTYTNSDGVERTIDRPMSGFSS